MYRLLFSIWAFSAQTHQIRAGSGISDCSDCRAYVDRRTSVARRRYDPGDDPPSSSFNVRGLRQRAEGLLTDMLKKGGVCHLWGHSWEVNEHAQWSNVERAFVLLAQFKQSA